ncbi:MAG: hypothetical protein IT382_06025, partial [Deltaproteobacteria bacterium]|nr:hypothetical protein [Deltaproteobacteria bacterium]
MTTTVDASGAPATTLATILAPFGRLPAAAVVFVADELIHVLGLAHSVGAAGHDLQPAAITLRSDGKLELRAGTSPYWLLPPERAKGAPASASGDLFSAGALLLHLLTGERALDAGSPPATAERLLKLVAPLPVAERVPTVPGFLERLLLALLQPDPAKRPADAAAARALLGDRVAALASQMPDALAVLARDPHAACAAMHEQQAVAEAQRGVALLGQTSMRRPAAVALLRSHALVPGRPEVEERLAQAAAAGVVRRAAQRDAELVESLAAIRAAEPAPRPAHLRRAAELLLAGGELLEAAAMMKRVLAGRPDDLALRHQLDLLVGPEDATAPWQAGGSWVVDRAASSAALSAVSVAVSTGPPATATGDVVQTGLETALEPALELASRPPSPSTESGVAASPSDAPTGEGAPSVPTLSGDETPVRGQVAALLGSLSATYASLDGRSRLFVLALAGSALLSLAVLIARNVSAGSSAERSAALEALSRNAADCGPGGGVRLLRAWQAARVGDAEAVEEQLASVGFDDNAIPAGTRCQRYSLALPAQALLRKGEAREVVKGGPDSVDELVALLGKAGLKIGKAPKVSAMA